MKRILAFGFLLTFITSTLFPVPASALKAQLTPTLSPAVWATYKKDPAATGYLGEQNYSVVPGPVWSYNLGSNGAAVVDEHGVLVVADFSYLSEAGCPRSYGKMRGLDYYSGSLLWEEGSCDGFVGIMTAQEAPTYANGLVFFTDEGFDGPDNAQVHALNSSTGEHVWTRSDLGYHSESSPLAVDGQVIVAMYVNTITPHRERIYSLDQATGETNWYIDFEYGTFEEEFAYDKYSNALYALQYQSSFGYRLHKISLTTGTLAWQTGSLGSSGYSAPTLTESGVIVGARGTFYHFSSQDGGVLWQRQFAGYADGSAALTQKLGSRQAMRKVVVSWHSAFYPFPSNASLLDLDSGELISTWQLEPYGAQWASALVSGDQIHFNTYYDHLKIFSVSTGSLLWDSGALAQGQASTPPIIHENRLTVISGGGTINQWHLSSVL